jgi:hypothetical protein
MKGVMVLVLALLLALPLNGWALDAQELQRQLQELRRQMQQLQRQLQELQQRQAQEGLKLQEVQAKAEEAVKEAKLPSWFKIGGEYRARLSSLHGTVPDYYRFQDVLGWMLGGMVGTPSLTEGFDVDNDTILFNRFGLTMQFQPLEDVRVKTRLLMYKVWGHQTETPIVGPFFFDRFSVFDGTVAHVPQDNRLNVDYAYATWSNIADLPVWFSIGRRPSTRGVPSNFRQNEEKIGTAGVPCFMVDYAFDGLSIGWAPYIEALPGFYAKLCYGRGYDSGYQSTALNNPNDTDFVGLNLVPYEVEDLRVELQYQVGFNIFDNLPDGSLISSITTPSGAVIPVLSPVRANLGNIHWFGGDVIKSFEVGANTLHLFAAGALSLTDASDNLFAVDVDTDGDLIPDTRIPVAGLLYDAPGFGGKKEDHTGWHAYVGFRYDIAKSRTKLGAEYNYGSKYWITVAPAADDIWTSKLGTRGHVLEGYIIQELHNTPVIEGAKAFFRLGAQYYKFLYTGSNSWLGAPKKIDELDENFMNAQLMPPVETAWDVYLTFDVRF